MPDGTWPLHDLRLTVDELELRTAADADQSALADMVPPDLELAPSAPRIAALPPAQLRAVVMRQTFWRDAGNWAPSAWVLHFAVRIGGRLVGEQVLEGTDFAQLRTVDSYSWLAADERRHGIGTSMRRAVLALAFGPLGAEQAVSSAWWDNHASLGVSRKLGYRANGEYRHARDDDVDTMVHVRLPRADWLAGEHADGVAIDGVEACLPLFGL